VQSGWRVVDLGGNIGLFAILAAARGGHVVSYEPEPTVFAHLQANTAKWDVDCRQAAVLATANGTVRLYVHDERDIRNSVLSHDVSGGEMGTAVEVPAVALRDVLHEECDLLKVDVEGAEFDLFQADAATLRKAKRIIAEIHPVAGDPDQIRRALTSAGFEVKMHKEKHKSTGYLPLTAIRLDEASD
jgi:FkbM family methyltransferase